MLKKILVLLALFTLTACASKTASTIVVDSSLFPTVRGNSLEGKSVELPAAVAGAPAILLIGYKQNAQFDIDRWVLGLMQAGVKAKMLEVPTVTGIVPSIVSNLIEGGMRKGIPNEDWPSVVTVFSDADKIRAVLGDENPQSAHIVALDSTGKIIWSHNRGYSPRLALELKEAIEKVR